MAVLGSDRTTRHLGAGLTMAAVVGAFAFAGRWLDERTGLGPTFLLIGFALGGVGGFIHLVSVIDPTLLPFRPRPGDDDDADVNPDDDPELS